MTKEQSLLMKLVEFQSNKKGLSVIELLIAITCFGMVAIAIVIIFFNAYLNAQRNKEETLAIFLAEEGLEAVRSIRDNNWDNLINGEHGLIISENNWIFQETEEDIGDMLREGKRQVIVEEIGPDRKRVVSQITWKTTEFYYRDASLVTYFTNWRKEGDGQADYLLVDFNNVELVGPEKKILRGIYLDSSQGTLTIDKMIFVWDNENKIEQIRIDDIFVWKWNGPEGSPRGRQSSGAELDIENFDIHEGQKSEIDKVQFDGHMGEAVISIIIIMIDGSTKEVNNILSI